MPLLDETDYIPTEKYARAKELLKHAEMIGRHYSLYEKTLFQTEVNALRWDEISARWSEYLLKAPTKPFGIVGKYCHPSTSICLG